MKKLSLLFCLCALVMTTFAQLPNGSYAPAFTGYEINKTDGTINTTNPIVLYDWTDAGYPVFIDVFATWCGPCWSFHTGGYLENLYSQYGPSGTNELRVMAIEGSDGNYASLSGTGPDAGGSSTQGNWLNGVEYPVIPLAMSPNTTAFNNAYAIGYFPTIYMITPNRLVYEVGQQTTAGLYASISQYCPQYDATLANNGLIIEVTGFEPPYYCSADVTPVIKLQNVGTATMTSASFTIEYDGQTSTFDWTGSVERYSTANVTLPQISATTNGEHTYTVTINQVNGSADTDAAMNSISKTFNVAIEPTSTTIDEDFSNGIPSTWTDKQGLLFDYNISSGSHGKAIIFNAYSFDSGVIDELYLPYEDLSGMTTPVIKFDVAYRQYSTNSAERLRVMYSTNCGQTWTSAYTKSGSTLATAGTTTSNYVPTESQWRSEMVDLSGITDKENVILKFEFKSAYGNNIWIDNVQVLDGTGIAENNAEFKLYPNPVHSTLNIATDENIESVEIYNMQGQLLMVEKSNMNTINVGSLASGNYFARIITANGTTTQKFTKE
ncbi:MAG: T9SS type A sorting domain-containing protein [Bacteroidales bacterium]|nr:T9SS type A sorting domain-containing protein [Bacteroidales bacterium]